MIYKGDIKKQQFQKLLGSIQNFTFRSHPPTSRPTWKFLLVLFLVSENTPTTSRKTETFGQTQFDVDGIEAVP